MFTFTPPQVVGCGHGGKHALVGNLLVEMFWSGFRLMELCSQGSACTCASNTKRDQTGTAQMP